MKQQRHHSLVVSQRLATVAMSSHALQMPESDFPPSKMNEIKLK